jgi:flagellar hook-associated protein 2
VNYLQVSANNPGATTLQLNAEPSDSTGTVTNILSTADDGSSGSQGRNTVFNLNGLNVTSSSTSVSNVIPGLTLNFAGTTASASGASATVSVGTDPTQISAALQNLVSAYNGLHSQMAQQYGRSGGVLSGNSILNQINQAMHNILQYQGGGDMSNLEALGVGMADTSGQMSFNQSTFESLSSSQLASALSLLGSSTTGIGGLQQAFKAISDPIMGTAAAQINDWNTKAQNLTDQINTKNAAISKLQQTINQQLQAADAAVAHLTSQQSMLTASLTSLSYVSYGYNTNTNTSNTI